MKSKTTALILSIFVGGLGVDRFYLGYTGMGVLKLLTGGCLGILWLIDLINIAVGNLRPADGSKYSEEMAVPMTSAAPVQNTANAYENLERLAKLHEQGVLNDEEFGKLKKELLEKM